MGKKKIKLQQSVVKPVQVVTAPPSTNKLKRQLSFFIAIFSFLLYAQSISFDYAYDDITVVQGNRLIQGGIRSIPELMSSDYWYGFSGNKQGAIYRPASLIMFTIEWALFPNNPMPGHLINVVLYALTCVLLFSLLFRLFRDNLLIPFVCTMLYAAHPLHTEVVNNIKSRDEILCFLFSILALTYYLRYYTTRHIVPIILGSLFFFLALLSKETSIAFLVIIPLTLFVFRETNKRRLIYSISVLALITVSYLALRQTVSNHRPLSEGIGLTDNFLVNAKNYFQILASAIYILLRYVVLLVFPHPLSGDYSYAQIRLRTFSDPMVITATAFFAAATIFSLILIRKKNVYAYSILLFLGTVFPVSNIPFLFGSSMAERFLYMPSLGFCILVTLLLAKILKAPNIEVNTFNAFVKKYKVLFFVAAVIVVCYSIKTIIRSMDWKDSLALFRSAAIVSPKSARAHYGLGTALFSSALNDKDRNAEREQMLEQSRKEYETAIAIYPPYANAYIGLGLYYKSRADHKNSLDNFEKAMAYIGRPTPALYKELGYAYLKTGRFEESVAAFDSFLSLDAENSNILNLKGSALFGLRKYNEALQIYLKASAMNPTGVDILKNIGRCYFYLGDFNNAATYFKRCVDLQPGDSENYQLMGLTYQQMGDIEKANDFLGQYEKMKAGQK